MMKRLLPFLTLTLLFAALAVATPHFLTAPNLSSVVRQTAAINIMALGMTLVIVAGGIDLSVGSMLALSGFLGSMAMDRGWPIAAGVAVGLAAGLACGTANGIMTAKLRLNPFIVTLGTLGIYRGLAVVIGGGSLRGGEGSVTGTLIGAFIMGLLANGSDLLGISPYVQQAVIGAVIILAVLVDELRKRPARIR